MATRVLLVEDDHDYAILITRSLGDDFSVRRVALLQEAIAALRETRFDVVLVDLGLPDAQGLPVLERLRTTDAAVPILALTALDDEALAIEALQLGVQDYLLKDHDDRIRIGRAIRYAIARKQAEERLTRLATHDPLTGAGNRALFRDRLQQGLLRANRLGTHLALLYIDLDRFKPINENHGYEVGDSILQQVFARLKEYSRATDTIARMGGDEFTVILEGLADHTGVYAVIRRLLGALRVPYQTGIAQLSVTPSIGVAIYPKHGEEMSVLTANADAAMYVAKGRGGNGWQTHGTVRSL